MINIPLALVADYANVSREGKLNIMGIFDQIYADAVPALHPQMQLIITIVADRSEASKEHSIIIELIDADNIAKLARIEGTVKFEKPPSGEEIRINHILQLNNVAFNKYGEYSFKIQINGEVKKSLPIKLVQTKTSRS
jgi:hypothetical protein